MSRDDRLFPFFWRKTQNDATKAYAHTRMNTRECQKEPVASPRRVAGSPRGRSGSWARYLSIRYSPAHPRRPQASSHAGVLRRRRDVPETASSASCGYPASDESRQALGIQIPGDLRDRRPDFIRPVADRLPKAV